MDFAQAVADTFMPSHTNPVVKYLDLVLDWGLKILILLVPITFLPWTFEIFEFNKQFLLLGFGVVLLAVWVAKSVISREAKLVKSPLNWVALTFLVSIVLSVIFSIDQITSILGFYGRFNGGLVSMVGYLILYFLVLQLGQRENAKRQFLGYWLAGVGLGALVLLLQILGVRFLGFPAAQAVNFSPLGNSLNTIVLILTASLPLALFFARDSQKALMRWLSLGFVIMALVLVFLIDYQLGWIGLLIGSAVWLALIFWKNETVGFKWTILPSLALLLAVIGWPLVTTKLTRLNIPMEINLSMSASWKIAWENIKSNPVLGTGPETFIYGFSKYKPTNFNDSDFWAFRFDKASSEFAQMLGTVGFLGLTTYLSLFVMALYLSWRLLKNQSSSEWYISGAIITSFLILLVGNVFYFSNTTLAMFMWFMLALLASFGSKGQRSWSLRGSPRMSFLFSFGLAAVVMLAVGTWFGIGRLWAADYAYTRAQVGGNDIKTLDQAQVDMAQAVNLNPWRDIYRIGLAQVNLALANREAKQPVGKTETERQDQINRLQKYIAASIAAARSATELSKESVSNWEALGSIYRGTVLFARDSENWVITSFQKAIKLEPSNPALYTELGKAYLIAGNRQQQQIASITDAAAKTKLESDSAANINKAIEQFELAIKLKSTYTPAHFNEALAYELQGKIDQAIDKLERIRSYNPNDVDVLYELGSLYFGKAVYDKAETTFRAVTSLVPNHANAHYGLSLVYQKTGVLDKAIEEIQKVLDLNPGNQQIQQQLDALKKGETQNPVAPTPPANTPAPKK